MQKSTPERDPEQPPEEIKVRSLRRKTTAIGFVVTVILVAIITVGGVALLMSQLFKGLSFF